jgi:hypothetical protein
MYWICIYHTYRGSQAIREKTLIFALKVIRLKETAAANFPI